MSVRPDLRVEGEGQIAHQIGSQGFYARVWVTCENVGQQTTSITLASVADSDWHRSEGWTDAALLGVALGLKLATRSALCTVTRIDGMPCDINPTLVAIAAIRAVWAALTFTPDETLARKLGATILRR